MDDVVWFTKVQVKVPVGPHTVPLRTLMTSGGGGRSGPPADLDLGALASIHTPQEAKDLALVLGARWGWRDVVSTALSAGADVGAHCHAAIRYAARTNNTDVGRLLLAAGADGGAGGGEPLQQACRMDALEFAQLVWDGTRGSAARARAAHAARAAGSLRVLPWLLPLVEREETEAVLLACGSGNLPFVQTLMRLGVPDAPDLLQRAVAAATATKQAHVLAWLRTLTPKLPGACSAAPATIALPAPARSCPKATT